MHGRLSGVRDETPSFVAEIKVMVTPSFGVSIARSYGNRADV